MADVIRENTSLLQITRREVDMYAGNSIGGTLYPVLDDLNQTYTVLYVDDKHEDHPVWAVVMARVVGEYIVIDEDTTGISARAATAKNQDIRVALVHGAIVGWAGPGAGTPCPARLQAVALPASAGTVSRRIGGSCQ